MKKPGQHFGYPYCHQGNVPDPEFGWGKSCDDYVKPAALLGPHAGSLGLKFYTGKMFPAKYQGAMFIAKHGPWNRTKKYNGVYVAWPDGKGGAKVEEFMNLPPRAIERRSVAEALWLTANTPPTPNRPRARGAPTGRPPRGSNCP